MNTRQKKFAEYYAQSGNIVRSAIAAGYSENYAKANACKLLENVSISEYVRELSEKAQKARILTALRRQEILSEIAENEDENAKNRILAIDTLNKMTGEYMQNLSLTGNIGVNIIDDIG